jgi:general stress protein 26
MSEYIAEATDYIEKAAYAVLITVDEENKPSLREIGPFVNNGLNVYFTTQVDSQKVKHFNINPFVTLYFPNINLNPKEFKSLAITGKVSHITDETRINCVLDELGQKSLYYKNHISKEWFDLWRIYKLTSETLQFTDSTMPVRTIKIEV